MALAQSARPHQASPPSPASPAQGQQLRGLLGGARASQHPRPCSLQPPTGHTPPGAGCEPRASNPWPPVGASRAKPPGVRPSSDAGPVSGLPVSLQLGTLPVVASPTETLGQGRGLGGCGGREAPLLPGLCLPTWVLHIQPPALRTPFKENPRFLLVAEGSWAVGPRGVLEGRAHPVP